MSLKKTPQTLWNCNTKLLEWLFKVHKAILRIEESWSHQIPYTQNDLECFPAVKWVTYVDAAMNPGGVNQAKAVHVMCAYCGHTWGVTGRRAGGYFQMRDFKRKKLRFLIESWTKRTSSWDVMYCMLGKLMQMATNTIWAIACTYLMYISK